MSTGHAEGENAIIELTVEIQFLKVRNRLAGIEIPNVEIRAAGGA